MKLRLITLALVVASTPVKAHDFWLQPTQFQVAANAPLGGTFLVGHAASRERWNNNDRVVVLKDYFGGRVTDLRGALRSGQTDFVTQFSAPGVHVLGMQSNYAFSELPALRFDDYVKVEGLALISAARQRSNQSSRPGRERYSRRAKSLIQVGTQSAPDQRQVTQPIGLKLEIVPDRSPYALDGSRVLPIHVLYNGRRLAGATVKLTNLANDARPVAVAITDKSGRARFRVPARGNWLLNVVWGEPVAGSQRFDYDTVFSSLTFGYPKTSRDR